MNSQCPLCGSSDYAGKFSERGHELRQCRQCDLFYIWPYPESDVIQSRVEDYDYDELDVLSAEKHHQASIAYYQRLFPQLQPYFQGARSVLDVGTGTGHLLERIRTQEPEAKLYGVELNHDRAEYARRLTQATIYAESIFSLPADQTYDAISLINVFSHIPPRPLFDKLISLLSPNGRLIIQTGELQSDVAKSDLHDWGIPDHLQFMGLNTISYITQHWPLTVEAHHRRPLADVRFSRETFAIEGRSALRNTAKQVALAFPVSIDIARTAYKLWKGQRIYSSLIVLRGT